jgi:alpha-L-fucosidase
VKDTIVTNDRWGDGTAGAHGGYYSYGDRFDPGVILPHKWECCMTLDWQSWGFRRTMTSADVISDLELVSLLARVVRLVLSNDNCLLTICCSCNGNLLINIGPTSYGMVPPIFELRLRTLGDWLKYNSEGIYNTKPWVYQNDTINRDVWFVNTVVYNKNVLIGIHQHCATPPVTCHHVHSIHK